MTAEANQIELEFIRPGRPMQNGFIERFNRTYRQAVLDMYIFESLEGVRRLTAAWLDFYNARTTLSEASLQDLITRRKLRVWTSRQRRFVKPRNSSLAWR